MKDLQTSFFDKAITFCFYSIFFFVPLAMHPNTYELFEFNKMWVVFIFTIIIGFMWISKMIMTGKIFFKRTPFDIPIFLFFLSQLLSTIFSIDPYVSIWGYYSRFNGGLLSTVSYIFLYYAFASNLTKNAAIESNEKYENNSRNFNKQIQNQDKTNTSSISYRLLLVSLVSGTIVTLWGLPSHFGYDPTCLVFRGTLDVSCWTASFQPQIRMFSTLGQPNWLAAYLAIITLIAFSLLIISFRKKIKNTVMQSKKYQTLTFKSVIWPLIILGFITLSFIEIIYTDSQSGFLGFIFAIIIFLNLYLLFLFKINNFNIKYLILFFASQIIFGLMLIMNVFVYSSQYFQFIIATFFLLFAFQILFILKKHLFNILKQDKSFQVITLALIIFLFSIFFIGHPIRKIRSFTTFQELKTKILPSTANPINNPSNTLSTPQDNVKKETVSTNIDSGITDSGKIRNIVWRGAYDLFTKHPLFGTGVETFAYSYYETRPKEHNLTSEWDFIYNKAHNEYLNYLATTGLFGLVSYILLITIFVYKAIKTLMKLKEYHEKAIIGIGLVAAYISILFSNFFGFSVVILNLYLFIIPILFIDIVNPENGLKQLVPFTQNNSLKQNNENTKPIKMLFIIILAIIAIFMELSLINFWRADINYALGSNLSKVGEYTQAYKSLVAAYNIRPEEDLYKDELSANLAMLSLLFKQQGQEEQAENFSEEAKRLSDEVVKNHPNNVIYYKTRTRVFYMLSQNNKKYLKDAIKAIEKANVLAPTDAKILYNMGLLYEEDGLPDNAVESLKKSIEVRPIYRDARFALASYYIQMEEKETDMYKKIELKQKAREQLEFILNNLGQNDEEAKKLLEAIK